jgi:hypothetical protein
MYLVEIQKIWNKLVDKVARNRAFLNSELEIAAKVDPFTENLLRMYNAIPDEIIEESYQLGIFRSDYMIDVHLNRPIQVEINTISSSFACLSQKVGQLQNYLLKRCQQDQEFIKVGRKIYGLVPDESLELPVHTEHNHSREKLAEALALAHATYGQPTAVIAFIVQPNEKNVSSVAIISFL